MNPFRTNALCAGLLTLVLLAAGGLSAHAQDDRAAYDPALFEGLQYRMVGPTRGGRVTTVAGHQAHPHTFYMGSTGGGVWKTTDYGKTWRNISDGYFDASPSMGALAIAPSDTSILYAGTGSDGIRSNVITGRGLYKSTDAGATWQFMGLSEAGQIGAIEVHPGDPSRLYVAALGHPFGTNAQRGVFRSTDGGQMWEKVLYASDSTGAIDLELHPANPDIIYAALWRAERKPWTIISGAREEDGIYRSTDGGDTWKQMTEGLPELIGKIDFAVSADDPDRVYALVEDKEPHEGLYRSDDRGETWRLVNDQGSLMTRPFYFTNVTADPTDADVVYVGNVRFFKSTDGGETFERRPTPHVDNHALWINPENPDIMVQGNDGGANVTLDGGKTWSTLHNQPTAELYQVAVDDQFPYWLYAGQQDNSTIAVPSLPPAESAPLGPESWWRATGGCETGPAVPKPGDPTIIYSNCKGRFGRYSTETGQEKQYWVGAQYMYGRNPAELEYRFQRTVPVETSPHDPSVVYHASQYLHRTTDEGATWTTISPDLTANKPQYQVASGRPITRDITGEEHYSAIYVVEVSPHAEGTIWVGANDGPVHLTRDGGATWAEVTPPAMPPDGRINAIEVSPHDPAKVYVAGYRYLLDDWRPYIYKTEDYGQSWTLLTDGTNGIPADYPTRVVREDPSREGLLYAGTEFGMFISFDDGRTWQPFQQNLPVTPITDLEVHEKDLVLSTMGRSFWIMDNLTPLHQLADEVAAADAYLFAPRDAYRMRYRGGSYSPVGPQYPPPGAMIDYYLAEAPEGPLTLEILDASGAVIRAFTSADDEEEEGEEQESPPHHMQEPMARVEYQTEALAAAPGMHRFIWNLQYPGTWSDGGRRGDGPLAAPGEYQVRLSTGDWSAARPLRLRIDPRIAADGVTVADLEEQLRCNLDLRDAISRARRAAARIDSAQAGVQAALNAGERTSAEVDPLQADLLRIEEALVTAEAGSYPPPMLIDQLTYLYRMTTSADQALGRDAFARYEELQQRLDEVLSRWARVEERVAEAAALRPGTSRR